VEYEFKESRKQGEKETGNRKQETGTGFRV
jgi:hypothetical protein